MRRGAVMRRGWLAISLALAGCVAPEYRVDFHIRRAELTNVRAGETYALRLVDDRMLKRTGALVFVRGNQRSPRVYVRSLVVGAAGICLLSTYPSAGFWRGIRVHDVDPRIVRRVIQPPASLHVSQLSDGTWELDGTSSQLRDFVEQHLRAVEDSKRAFIDLTPLTYEVLTTKWSTLDEETLRRASNRPAWYARSPRALVGWAWSEIETIDYYQDWPNMDPELDVIDAEIASNDRDVRHAIETGSALAPGPCPIVGEPTHLLFPGP